MKTLCIIILQTIILSILVLSSVFQVSCTLTESGIHVLSGDYDTPKIVSYGVRSATTIAITFSEPVSPKSATVSDDTVTYDTVIAHDGDKTLVYTLSEQTVVGKAYSLYSEIKDAVGNTLTFSIPFTGYNDHCALLALTEIQDGKASSPTKHKLKYEYVELLVLRSGNLSGLILSSAYDGLEQSYAFPPIEVTKDEVIVVHMRSDEEDNCIDEIGADLSLASGYVCTDSARDLWAANTKACFGSSCDVITLTQSADNHIQDAFVYIRSDRETWTKVNVGKAAATLPDTVWNTNVNERGAFIVTKSSSPVHFVRTVINKGIHECYSSPSDWAMVTPSKASPGIFDGKA
ncbi:MAG: Ig-like domain-containing protein [Treponema sp.]|nr:Ig-like domain-containing protein [Treponema sp.]